ncbi:MAG: hypothetical protein EXQ55_08360 [Acidobacteria bacterium]|nr:hypothetical protein [Acidobacteriota bacterium]
MIPRVLLSLMAAFAACARTPEPLPAPIRFAAPVAKGHRVDTFAVSHDGRWLTYAAETAEDGRRRVFIRALAGATDREREVPGTMGGKNPFFSPDGASIAYFARGGVWRVPAHGDAEPQRIADAPLESAGGTWSEDGRIFFAPLGDRGLMAVPAVGGPAVVLTALNAEEGEMEHGWPHALPRGGVVFTVTQRGRDPHLEVLSAGGQRTRLRVPAFGQSHFVSTGHLVYGYLGNLMTVKFDADASAIRGVPASVAKGLQTTGGYGQLGRASFAASRAGTLVWVRAGPEDATSELVRVTRDGRYQTIAAPAAVYQTPRLSPDGRRLAVVVRPGVMTREIHVLDIARPGRAPIAIRGGDNQSPAWMDNRRLTFGSNRDGLQKIYVATPGASPVPLFTADVAAARNPASWIRSPQLLALYEIDPIRRRDVLVYRVGESIVPVAATRANERSPALSPDGKWIAYVSDASGRDEIFVKPMDGSMEALQMTSGGAVEPVWTREGLFFRERDTIMLAALDSGAPGTLRELFEGHFERDPGANLAAYDVDRQGNFIMLRSRRVPRELRVVLNWSSELP